MVIAFLYKNIGGAGGGLSVFRADNLITHPGWLFNRCELVTVITLQILKEDCNV